MNRIDQKFKELRAEKRKAFIVFITAGDPSLKATEELVLAFENSGVDLIEIGVPFSDPLADGPTIQASSQRSLKQGTTLDKVFTLVKKIRRKSSIPLALMMYYNPIFHYGEQKFINTSKACGVDGVIVPDLPPEEAGILMKLAKAKDISTILFLSPTTTKERMKKIINASSGFIYYVSLTGVTGARQQIPASFIRQVKEAKRLTKKPICVGFGISTPDQVKKISKVADGVIVGSAIVAQIFKNKGNTHLIKNVAQFVRGLCIKKRN